MNKKISSRTASNMPSLRELLMKEKTISSSQATDLDRLCFETGINFSTALMFKGYCSVSKLAQLLEERLSIRYFPIKSIPGIGKIKNLISEEKAKELQVFPLTLIEESGQKIILLGMTDPLDLPAIRKVEFLTHLKVQPAFLPLDELQDLYLKYYRRGLEIFPVEVTFYGEKTSVSRASTISPTKENNSEADKIGVKALVQLLVKKGIITFTEFENECQKLLLEASKA
jgi:Type II secretion system (T2SS), protein E, N-terminal domain